MKLKNRIARNRSIQKDYLKLLSKGFLKTEAKQELAEKYNLSIVQIFTILKSLNE